MVLLQNTSPERKCGASGDLMCFPIRLHRALPPNGLIVWSVPFLTQAQLGFEVFFPSC